ncbi:MAG: nucleotide sugar dehydrogenase [Candidatus Eisenbacteria sp.]|nr:nucleotide sugar dehydrogenase [Candidatus Eisenbacteria bacterium]
MPLSELRRKIKRREARVGVIGTGYVGLPLAVEFASAGFDVVGIDTANWKVDRILKGDSYIPDVDSDRLQKLVRQGKLSATTEWDTIGELDSINICVPTPLRKTQDPDVSHIIAAVKEISKRLRPGQLIILESTTYPGTTEEVILPSLEKTGLKVGKDFHLAFSPERVDPGNRKFKTGDIPKVVGGITPACTETAVMLYQSCLKDVVAVSSTKVAEMVKLLENTFRSVNIGLVNEISLMCHQMKINVWEVIDAAATKPFGFMPFYPGPGLGGHCIPIDPFYLSWKAKLIGFEARFIELAGRINGSMPYHVVGMISDALNEVAKSLRGSRILILGVAYKRDIDDVRESPALDIIRILQSKGAEVSYSDPYVANLETNGSVLQSAPLSAETLPMYDCVTIVTDHSNFDYKSVANNARIVVDTRNALSGITGTHIHRL